jgi:hypothetical protein
MQELGVVESFVRLAAVLPWLSDSARLIAYVVSLLYSCEHTSPCRPCRCESPSKRVINGLNQSGRFLADSDFDSMPDSCAESRSESVDHSDPSDSGPILVSIHRHLLLTFVMNLSSKYTLTYLHQREIPLLIRTKVVHLEH